MAIMLRRYLNYDPETGVLSWREKSGDKCVVGKEIGSLTTAGYIQLQVAKRKMTAHRVAWTMFHGEPPAGIVDHINNVRTDNRIANLRIATPEGNSRNSRKPSNNTSGIKGVSQCTGGKRWLAQIAMGGGKTKNLGRYATKEAAGAAYAAAAAQYHGEFARTN